MKHTSGPWISELDEDAELGHFDIRDSDDNRVAEITNDYADYDHALAYWQSDDCPMEANAHLIAAAPELLEALKEMIDRERRKYGRSDLAQKIFRTNNSAALEVVAKVRGEQS